MPFVSCSIENDTYLDKPIPDTLFSTLDTLSTLDELLLQKRASSGDLQSVLSGDNYYVSCDINNVFSDESSSESTSVPDRFKRSSMSVASSVMSSGSDMPRKKRKYVKRGLKGYFSDAASMNLDGHYKETLMHAPIRIQESINKGDVENVEYILEDVCHENCTLQTSPLHLEVDGKQKAMEWFQDQMMVYPDFIMRLKSSSFHRYEGALVSVYEACGTKCFPFGTEDSFLFNGLRFEAHDSSLSNQEILNLKRKALQIESSGVQFKFTADLRISLILSRDCSAVERVIIATNLRDIQPVGVDDDHDHQI